MEVTDLSELCRLCLDSSTTLYPFETPVHFSKKSLPQLVKFCTDVDCSGNDGGIAPKNVCNSCLELLKIVFEFKSKSLESDRYLKQIISHSTAREAPLIPASIESVAYEDSYQNEDDLLQPLDDDDDDDSNSMLLELKKGQRHGDFECKMCRKFFKYVKPYKNHMKMHNVRAPMPKVKEKLSYYKRKKLRDALQNSLPKKKAPVPTPKSSYAIPYADSSPEPQPEYDSLSPYQNSPAYEDDSIIPQDNDMDFGALMLSTSQMIGEEVEKDNPEPRKSRTGRILKRIIIEDDDEVEISKPNGQKRSKPTSAPSNSKAPPARKPGPLSSKKPKPSKPDDSEEITIEGFSEVDISKMLKKTSDSMTRLGDHGSQSRHSRASASNSRSRSRSSSVELIDEIDIFDR